MSFEDIIKNDTEQLSKAMETDAAKFFTHEVNARKMSSLNYQKLKEWRSLKAKRNWLLKNHGYKVEDTRIRYVSGDVTKLTDIESAELRRINHAMDKIQFNGHQLKDLMVQYGVKKLWNL